MKHSLLFFIGFALLCSSCDKSGMYSQAQLDEKIAHAVDSTKRVELKRVSRIINSYAENLIASDSLTEALELLRMERVIYNTYPTNYFAEGWILDQMGRTDEARRCFLHAYELHKIIGRILPTWGNGVNQAFCLYAAHGRNAYLHEIDSIIAANPDSAEYTKEFRKIDYEAKKNKMMHGSRTVFNKPDYDIYR